ncbi:MAG TPA: hypothetical protein PLH91_00085 [Tenuifilaceae bacterium]|nr:hypothetical protein [Tenuifilaceae bacterium]HOZ13625.1 hypothetical protein [Tenuifilaceae bacterium]HPI43602.1 hypothetical protein [Tenuifilaceae bacterium]HPN22860.1 hypothetical protein [Tenuifilaceae bacterium]HPV56385.1 hypothetical protein [Tenuifilaceae bacterium]
MKSYYNFKIQYFIILALLINSACDDSKSLRHIFRAANRASQIEKAKPEKSQNDYLISFTEAKDSTGSTVFTALYTLPNDTNMFFLNLSYNMPEKLGFDGRLDSCTVNAVFFKYASDTATGNAVYIHVYRFVRKLNGFYDISCKKSKLLAKP